MARHGIESTSGHPRFRRTDAPALAAPSLRELTAARSYSIAHDVARWLLVFHPDDLLVVVHTHDIWPSSVNRHLCAVWRRSHGESRSLDEAPGHLFESWEDADLATLVHLALLGGWEFSAHAAAGLRSLAVSHEGETAFSAVAPTVPFALEKALSPA